MPTKILKKVVFYSIGLFFLAFGVTFSMKSNLGISPINAIPYVLSVIFVRNQGEMITLVFCIFILLQIILLRKKFKLRNLLQIVFASIFGYFVNFSNSIFTFPTATNYVLQLALLAVSIIFISIGVIMYLEVDLIPMPAEGVMMAIVELTGIPIHKVKQMFDISMVLVASVFSIVFLLRLQGVREGTIIAAIMVGKVIGVFKKLFKKQITWQREFVK